jgi:CheY-specific phosphatase CheX
MANRATDICLQIVDHAKKILSDKGFEIQPAGPTVVLTDAHSVKHFSPGPVLSVQFRSIAGTFVIEVAISR